MNILVTGAGGFVGKNLVQNLKNIKERKNRTRPALFIEAIYEYDRNTERDLLEVYCQKADFVFHLAGANRPKDTVGFEKDNVDFLHTLLETLRLYNSKAPIMLASSVQASLTGRFEQSVYGESKKAGEELLFKYSQETGIRVLVYRFPNLFGKWCKPNYNSVVATFCNAVANGLKYTVNNRDTEIELVYIDDLVEEMCDALEAKEHHCEYDGLHVLEQENGRYCYVPVSHMIKLGEIIDLLTLYKRLSETLEIPEIPEGSFAKKLFSTYLSYLPSRMINCPLVVNQDNRGAFVELFKTKKCGQISVNITKPGNIRGQHWHNSKWEIFVVVSGHGLIRERKIGLDERGNLYPIIEFEVTGQQMQAVRTLPGYTHNIINLSETEDLVTIIWANEKFDSEHPDTFSEIVDA